MPELAAMKSTQNKKGRGRARQQETRKCWRGDTKKDRDNDRKGKDKDNKRHGGDKGQERQGQRQERHEQEAKKTGTKPRFERVSNAFGFKRVSNAFESVCNETTTGIPSPHP